MSKPSSSSTSRPQGGPRNPAGSAGPAPTPAPRIQRTHRQPAQGPRPQDDPAVRQADNYGGQKGRDQASNPTGSPDAAGQGSAKSDSRGAGRREARIGAGERDK